MAGPNHAAPNGTGDAFPAANRVKRPAFPWKTASSGIPTSRAPASAMPPIDAAQRKLMIGIVVATLVAPGGRDVATDDRGRETMGMSAAPAAMPEAHQGRGSISMQRQTS